MRGRENKGPQPTDLLVCFPSRAHLSLMPKPICSPARPSSDSSSPFHHHHHRHHQHPHHRRRPSLHQLRKSSTRGGGGGHGSPLMWAKTKPNNNNNSDISEPTSPKVTCAGQIKVRTSKPNSCKNWQSVMEEIERMHNSRKQKKRPAWIEALGFKKEVMQFLTCLRNVRFDFRCFGSIPAVEISSDDDEEEEDDEEDRNHRRKSSGGGEASSGDVFSKWFMILQEENLGKEMIGAEKRSMPRFDDAAEAAAPPKNALLLMRCRSAPAKSWLEEREEEGRERSEREECDDEDEKENGKRTEEESNFCEFAVEIAKEDWINQEKILRSRSWKR